MKELVEKYTNKLIEAHLVESGAPVFGALDAEFIWNRKSAETETLQKVFNGLHINSLLFSAPAEPYKTIIDFLCAKYPDKITPGDTETRTFLHDLPVAGAFDADELISLLGRRKCAIIKGRGVVTFGTVSPEQAFVAYSSVCFACFVKFFSDYLVAKKKGALTAAHKSAFQKAVDALPTIEKDFKPLMPAPFKNEDAIYAAIEQAGRHTVEHGLVDSYFGNVSYRFNDTLYISQTGSSLEELNGVIDACPLDNSSCVGITASSEFSAHKQIVEETGVRAILHGHPKFSVIISLDCDRKDCEMLGQCHIKCPHKRFMNDIPIIPGEVGTGAYGLSRTLPPTVRGKRGAIVYGHGVFTVSEKDFNLAFKNLLDIERECKETYFKRIS